MSSPHTPSAVVWLGDSLLRWSLGILVAVAAGVVMFESLHLPMLSPVGLPHEVCYIQQPKLIWLHVVADSLIGAAYVSISGTLGYLVYRASRDIPFHWIFLAFGLFIVSCGLTHFLEVWVIWRPMYWLSGYVKVVTAAASVATAIAMYPLLPKIFGLIASARASQEHLAEIERLNEELARFNYSVAHDLRAPLRSISGFGQILQDDFAAELSADARHYLDRIQRSAEKMDALVTALLRYATIGRQPVAVHPVALADVLRNTLSLLAQDITDRSADVRIVGSLPSVLGDEMLLQLVFQNLLSNAMTFVAPGVAPVIEITATREGREVVVSVTDNGIGFPPAAQERIFGMFERFHPNYTGTGIGLAIVQRAVQRLQGQIGVAAAPNGGSRFLIRLPRA